MAINKNKLTLASFYVWCFLVCSFIGWVYECIWKTILVKSFVNPGFLHGYYLPIYGFGGLLLILCLKKYMDKTPSTSFRKYVIKPIVMFLLITVLVSALEYVVSYVMEIMFHQRWWDYKHLAYNLNGRIALSNSLILGAMGFVFVYIVHPLMKFLCDKVSPKILNIVALLIVLMVGIDTIYTLLEMYKII